MSSPLRPTPFIKTGPEGRAPNGMCGQSIAADGPDASTATPSVISPECLGLQCYLCIYTLEKIVKNFAKEEKNVCNVKYGNVRAICYVM